jgi:hypothetical protein
MLARWTARLGVLAAVGLAFALIAAAPSPEDRHARRVAALIERLGDDDFDEREKAERELTRIGKPGGSQLARAALTSKDLEIRKRAAKILEAVDPGAIVRARRAERVRALTLEIAKVEGVDATTWGESIANPFTALTEEGKKKLRAEGVEVDRLSRMKARLITGSYYFGPGKTFVNRDPDVILVFARFSSYGDVHSVGPVLAADDTSFMGQIRGAGLVWCLDDSYPRGRTSGMPLVVAPSVVRHLGKLDADALRGDYGWKAPKDFCKPLLAATRDDPAATEELAAERKRLTALIKKVKGIDVKAHAEPIANPFTNLTDEGKKKLKARGVDVIRLTGLKKALHLGAGRWSRDKPFVNADPDAALVLDKGFDTSLPVYSLGPVVVLNGARLSEGVTGADLVWLVGKTRLFGEMAGAPVVVQPAVNREGLSVGGKQVWHGDYGWRRPDKWPGVEAKKD